jgi:hypothetical protein
MVDGAAMLETAGMADTPHTHPVAPHQEIHLDTRSSIPLAVPSLASLLVTQKDRLLPR